MTTDIKELPLLVSKAKASLFTLEYISQFEPADIDADNVDLRFEVGGRETGTNVSIVDECGQAAEIIMALIEALEAKGAECHRLSDELRGATALVTLMKIDARELSRELEAKDARISDLELDRGQLFIAHRTLLNQWATISELLGDNYPVRIATITLACL